MLVSRHQDKETAMRQWTEKERKRQACAIRRTKPWKKSTGPKTPEGKERAKMNAFKSGMYTPEYKILRRALTLQAEFVRGISLWAQAEDRMDMLRERTVKE